MKYFLHDTNAFNDEKVTELFIRFGYEGIGLFFTILERIALQEKPIKTIVLKNQLKVGKKLEKIWKFMEEIEIISSNNGETFNEKLLNFSEKYRIKKEMNRIRIANFRKKQTKVMHYSSICNNPKVKESKVKVMYIVPPTLEMVKNYCQERKNTVDPERFINFYEAKGWLVGKNRMKDWQAAVRTWEEKKTPEQEARDLVKQIGANAASFRFQAKYGDELYLKYRDSIFQGE